MSEKRKPRISGEDLFRALYDAEQYNQGLIEAQRGIEGLAEINDGLKGLIKRLRAFRSAHFGESAFDAACRRATRIDIRAIQIAAIKAGSHD